MSQMRLAEKIGVSYQQVQKYEKGMSELTLSRLYQISEALGVDPAKFLSVKVTGVAESLSPYGKSAPQDEVMLLDIYRRIRDKKVKESLLLLLKGIAEAEKHRP